MTTASRDGTPRGAFTAVLVVAAAVRLGFWALGLEDPSRFVAVDSEGYLALAGDLGAAYLGDTRHELFALGLVRPPGYPVLLAALLAVGGSIPFLALTHVLIGVGVVWATHALTRSLLDPRAALVAAAIVAVEPASIVYSSLLLTEVPFTLLLVLGALFTWKGLGQDHLAQLGIGGGLWGLATLVRPVTLLLPLVLLPGLYVLTRGRDRRRRTISALVVVVAFALPVGGWVARNAVLVGTPVLTTIDGTNLLYYRAAYAVAGEERRPLEDVLAEYRTTVRESTGASDHPLSRSRFERSLGIRELLAHPVGTVTMTLKGAGRLLLGPARDPVAQRFEVGIGHPAARLFSYASVALLVILSLLTVLGAARGARSGSARAIGFVVLLAGYIVAVSAGGEAYSRFRVPALPFLALLAAYAITQLVAANVRSADRPARRLATASHPAPFRPQEQG